MAFCLQKNERTKIVGRPSILANRLMSTSVHVLAVRRDARATTPLAALDVRKLFGEMFFWLFGCRSLIEAGFGQLS